MQIPELAKRKLDQFKNLVDKSYDKEEHQRKIMYLESLVREKEVTNAELNKTCFVMMPIAEDEPLASYFDVVIDPLARELGFHAIKIDRERFQGHIDLKLEGEIKRCGFCIADITGDNPNVFYEIGYATALAKRVILTSYKRPSKKFDLRQRKQLVYQNLNTLITELREEIRALLS